MRFLERGISFITFVILVVDLFRYLLHPCDDVWGCTLGGCISLFLPSGAKTLSYATDGIDTDTSLHVHP